MPFPVNLEAMEAAGYRYLRMDICSDCGLSREVFTTPAKREVACNPMPLLTDPAVEHWRTCKPVVQLPKMKDGLQGAGYSFLGRVLCGQCKLATDLYSHNGDQIAFAPMMDDTWPVVIHECKSVQSRTTEKQEAQTSGPIVPPPEHQHEQDGGKESQQQAFKMYGVNDPNGQLVAVGYDPVDGILRCQFKTALWSYKGVPEDKYHSLRKVPFAYSYFTKVIKSKFPAEKVSG